MTKTVRIVAIDVR
jgi:hypothetical protein